MALVACKECAKEISTETVACPVCGTPLPKPPADKSMNAEALTLIIALLIVVGAIYLAATKLSGI